MALKAPRVTVIMPCYNSERALAATLDSLLAQTFADYEVVTVNDGSIDETQAILERSAPRFGGRLRIIAQENAGQTASLSHPFGMASDTDSRSDEPSKAGHLHVAQCRGYRRDTW